MQNFDYNDPLSAQAESAKANLLRARQAQEYRTPQGPGMVGRVYVGAHPLQGLAEVLRTQKAANQEDIYSQELKDIGAQRQKALVEGLRTFNDTYSGTPAVAPQRTDAAIPAFDEADAAAQQSNVGGYSGVTGGQAAVKGNPLAAITGLSNSVNPMLAQAGIGMLAQYPQQREAALQRAADKQEERTWRSQEKELDRQNRADMIRLTAENRKPTGGGSAGPDWKYDAGSDTWVKPPSAEFPTGQTTPNAGKAASFKNFNYLANNMTGDDDKGGIISRTAQGGYFGLGGALGGGTQAAKEFDNNVEQMSTELRTVFRIPGEGALSDKEQAQYGIQLPKRGNDPELNRSIIRDLKVRMGNRVDPQGGQQSPNQPKPKAGGPKVGDAQDGFVFIGGNPADPKSWKKQ